MLVEFGGKVDICETVAARRKTADGSLQIIQDGTVGRRNFAVKKCYLAAIDGNGADRDPVAGFFFRLCLLFLPAGSFSPVFRGLLQSCQVQGSVLVDNQFCIDILKVNFFNVQRLRLGEELNALKRSLSQFNRSSPVAVAAVANLSTPVSPVKEMTGSCCAS